MVMTEDGNSGVRGEGEESKRESERVTEKGQTQRVRGERNQRSPVDDYAVALKTTVGVMSSPDVCHLSSIASHLTPVGCRWSSVAYRLPQGTRKYLRR